MEDEDGDENEEIARGFKSHLTLGLVTMTTEEGLANAAAAAAVANAIGARRKQELGTNT